MQGLEQAVGDGRDDSLAGRGRGSGSWVGVVSVTWVQEFPGTWAPSNVQKIRAPLYRRALSERPLLLSNEGRTNWRAPNLGS
jgi:hypothetical protein